LSNRVRVFSVAHEFAAPHRGSCDRPRQPF
jgi:hypothetical protein